VAIAVPGHGRHPVAEGDPEPPERVGELLRAPIGAGIVVPVDGSLDGTRHHLRIGVVKGGELDHGRDE